MSIMTTLRKKLSEGGLVEWEPTVLSDPVQRTLLLTPELHEEVTQDVWQDPMLHVRYGQLRADFDRFVTGDFISVALHPYTKDPGAFLARIDPVEWGAWTLRSVAPRPAIRVFSVFAKIDVLVGISSALRTDLDGPNGPLWNSARENALARWATVADGAKPHVGENVNDYVSVSVVSV